MVIELVMDKKLLGRWGEERAAEYLKGQRYEIVGMNYSCRFGEIDIIAGDQSYIVFVEVKLRKNTDFAQAREFVTSAKQRRIIAAAQLWLADNATDRQPRFDVVEIYTGECSRGNIRINHIKNAFEVNV